MGEINLFNHSGRDAVVGTQSVQSTLKVRWVDQQGRQAGTVRVLKCSLEQDYEAVRQRAAEPRSVGQALIDGDPEIDLEQTGKFLRETSRVLINSDRQIVHKVKWWEIIRNPDGSVRERRPRKMLPPNVTAEAPLRWSGVFIKKADAARRFVFSSKVQLHHINGLTYDFLFGIAKELEQRESLMLLGAGPKSNQPLILRRGGAPYRGFLEGRTDGERYCLLLHFSNLELKALPRDAAPAE